MNIIKNLFTESKSVPSLLETTHYPTLDGLRGISIIIVIFYHLNLSNSKLYNVIFNGDLGVNIFFVLSGFLITSLCIKEKVITHDLRLDRFYIRRVLRILPVAYLFLFVLFILNLPLKLNLDYVNFLGAGLFLYNFSFFRHYPHGFAVGHFWSLATEEQFYLLFPVMLKRAFKVYLIVILGIVFVVPILIYTQAFSQPNSIFYFLIHYLIKLHGISCGCLFSILAFKFTRSNSFLAAMRPYIGLIILFLIFYLKFSTDVNATNALSNLLISLLIGVFIWINLSKSSDLIYFLFNNKLIMKIGVLSYGIYIWQQIFTFPILPKPLSLFPYNLIFLGIVSCLSYYFYERYFIGLKKKFQKIKN